jgi:hypothetical protein
MYSIQHYVIKFVSDLRQVCGFLRELKVGFSTHTYTINPSKKLTCVHDFAKNTLVESGVKYHIPTQTIKKSLKECYIEYY